jgi:hypothetical protein
MCKGAKFDPSQNADSSTNCTFQSAGDFTKPAKVHQSRLGGCAPGIYEIFVCDFPRKCVEVHNWLVNKSQPT